jgi:hypothetical protein
MITETQLDEQTERVFTIAQQVELLKHDYIEESKKLFHLMTTQKAELKALAKSVMNTEAPVAVSQELSELHHLNNLATVATDEHPLVVLPSATISSETGDLSDLGRVYVDWNADVVKGGIFKRGSCGSYAVLAEDEISYTIQFGTRSDGHGGNVLLQHRVSKNKVKAA